MIPPTMTCSDVMMTCLANWFHVSILLNRYNPKCLSSRGSAGRGPAAQSLYTTLYYPSIPL